MSQFSEFQPNESSGDVPQSDPVGGQPPQLPPVGASRQEPRQERLRHVPYGSLDAIDITIKNLHARNYANADDWSDPIPFTPNGVEGGDGPEQWMVILTKILLIE